ncbi:MAG: hypothetical protein ACOZBZ_04635 [Patescibacteria group bacterium]
MKNYNVKLKILRFLVVIFIFSFLFFHSPEARAQTFSLSIYPPLLEVMMMPGKSIIQAYQLENSGDETIINTQILPFEPGDELGNVSLRGPTSEEVGPPKGWFSFENADLALGQPFVLRSGESKQIILRIKIPENTREDDYYFTFLFSTKPKERGGGTTTSGAGVIGSNILLTVSRSGKPVKRGEIVEFTLRTSHFALPIIDSFDKPEFLLRVKNTGRAFWKPFGKIKIEGLLGQKYEQELIPDNVLVGSIRQIQVATPSASPTSRAAGIASGDARHFALPTSFLLGPYRAKVEFSLEEDGGSQTLSAVTSFLALPGKLSLAILIAVSIVLLIKKRMWRY